MTMIIMMGPVLYDGRDTLEAPCHLSLDRFMWTINEFKSCNNWSITRLIHLLENKWAAMFES